MNKMQETVSKQWKPKKWFGLLVRLHCISFVFFFFKLNIMLNFGGRRNGQRNGLRFVQMTIWNRNGNGRN